MLCSSRMMSLCLSRIRCTSSRIIACAPAILRMTSCEDVSPASIISCTSCSEASGHTSCISRAFWRSSICLKSSWALWKSKSSCWCFRAMACRMLARIRPSAESRGSRSSASTFSSATSACFARATWPLVSSTSWERRSDTAAWPACVVACRASSSILPMVATPSRPCCSMPWMSLMALKKSRMKSGAGATGGTVPLVVLGCSSRTLPRASRPTQTPPLETVLETLSEGRPPLLRASCWNSAKRSLSRSSAAATIAAQCHTAQAPGQRRGLTCASHTLLRAACTLRFES
mmetsp:Transcript_101799/g.328523  ORF Transcript_101799/g.328523 Transcript_101799/m.328523 type:complete len:289 (+) Transcript_101799:377-1243(+)